MGLVPQFKLETGENWTDITSMVSSRLISLRYVDATGLASDMLEIVMADNDMTNPIILPTRNAQLKLSLGYDGALTVMGIFVVDEIELSGYPGELTIRGRAAGFTNVPSAERQAMQSQHTRSWDKGTTLKAVVQTIAKAHGLTPAIDDDLAVIVLHKTIQSDESDIHFLIRLCMKYDAVIKPVDGKLVVTKKARFKSITGKDLPPINIKPEDTMNWRVLYSSRETAGEIVAYYHDLNSAKRHEVSVGTGDPVKRLAIHYPTQAMALAAAQAELKRKERGEVSVYVTMIGTPSIYAEAPLVMSGFRDGVDGEWVITRAEHNLTSQGYVINVEGQKPTGNDYEWVDSED